MTTDAIEAAVHDLQREVRELREALHALHLSDRQALLMQVDALERCECMEPRTAELRKEAKHNPRGV